WNARGLALMHLRRFDEAMKSFDVALSLNPGSEAAIEARKLCEERAAIARIEAVARAVVQFERTLRRPASKEEIFKACQVPLEILDSVVSFVNTPASVKIDAIPSERIAWFEKASLALLQNGGGKKEMRLVDVVDAIPDIEVTEAREVLGYLNAVRSLRLEPDPTWKMDALIRRALDLPKTERNLVDLSRELNIGPYEAKKLEVSLRIFEGGAYRVRTKPDVERGERPRPKAPPREAPPKASAQEKDSEPEPLKPRPGARPSEPREAPAPEAPPKEAGPQRERPRKRDEGEDTRDFTRL
ncbi:MAG TPA: tetratricopeptide repeat protein, partial [Thermoplasmata archaeon]|nr:tetratricopeptide repeat protein [Thermoplasmata archaeon]